MKFLSFMKSLPSTEASLARVDGLEVQVDRFLKTQDEMLYNLNLQKQEFETFNTNMRKFTKQMNENQAKFKDFEQLMDEEDIGKITTDLDIIKTELDGLKRDQLLNEQNDEKLRSAVNDVKKSTQLMETQAGRDMKQIQSILNELTRRADAADVTGENLSVFVTGRELRD